MSRARGPTFSETWWGSRWIQSLRRFGRGWSQGLTTARGANAGVRDLEIFPGRIEARVSEGSGDEVHDLRIRLHTLSDGTWRRVLRRLASKAVYAARLLSGEMPRDIERVFAQSRASLFPRRPREIQFECSCDQQKSPCSHVAAVQFVLAEAFDRDPFLLFELRGRGREQVLAELREIRGRSASGRNGADVLGDDDARMQPRPEDYTVAGEDLGTLGFHIAAPEVTLGAIRALGPPRSWPQPLAVLETFVPLYRAASAVALDIAWLGEEEVPASARLPEPETDSALVAMAESMARPNMPSGEVGPSSHKGRGRKIGGSRRGRRGQGRGGQSAPGRRRRPGPSPEGGPRGKGHAAAEQTGKKPRRRRRRRGAGAAGGSAGGAVGGGQPSPAQGNKKKRRRRRRGGGGRKA